MFVVDPFSQSLSFYMYKTTNCTNPYTNVNATGKNQIKNNRSLIITQHQSVFNCLYRMKLGNILNQYHISSTKLLAALILRSDLLYLQP